MGSLKQSKQSSTMSDAKVYLNVPYAQKDAAKAVGARWDPGMKKWYVPPGKSLEPFADWRVELDEELMLNPGNPVAKTQKGLMTQPSINPFAAYDGIEAPWD
jgi:hypothetical protein